MHYVKYTCSMIKFSRQNSLPDVDLAHKNEVNRVKYTCSVIKFSRQNSLHNVDFNSLGVVLLDLWPSVLLMSLPVSPPGPSTLQVYSDPMQVHSKNRTQYKYTPSILEPSPSTLQVYSNPIQVHSKYTWTQSKYTPSILEPSPSTLQVYPNPLQVHFKQV